MPKIVSIANLKGGVGKTSIAVNLAGALQSKGLVVLVDADEQGSAAAWSAGGKLPFRVQYLPLEGAGDARRWMDTVLAIAADVVVVDCPPHVGAATETAIGLSDVVIIPCFSGIADLRATESAVEIVRRARQVRNDKRLPYCVLVPSRVDSRTLAGREIEDALKRFHEPIGPAIHQRAAFIDSCSAGLTIGQYAPESPADQEIQALRRRVKL